jgi:hypothetical protein
VSNTEDTVVYFAGAVRGDRSLVQVMQEIIQFLKDLDLTVLTEYIGTDNPDTSLAGKVGKTREDLTDDDIEKQSMVWLDQATHLVAEVSGASTGTGREIEYARTKEDLGKVPTKVLCLYLKERQPFVSAMVRGMTRDRYPNVFVQAYADLEEAKSIIRKFLEV